jgi:hypothetical protein
MLIFEAATSELFSGAATGGGSGNGLGVIILVSVSSFRLVVLIPISSTYEESE